MTSQHMQHIKSGGRRMDLYAELGRYFSPEGCLDEEAFRAFLRESLRVRLGEGHADEARPGAGAWLSSHIEEVLAYLEDRGLEGATCALFEAAADEAASLGIDTVNLSPARLRQLLAHPQRVDGDRDLKRRRNPDEKRRKITETALKVFAERGFHESTMEEIALESGVAKGTLYRYFTSKDDLLEQLLRGTSRDLAVRFAGIFAGDGDILDKIQGFIEAWLTFIEENHVLYRLLQTEGINGTAGRQTMIYECLLADFPMVKERFAALDTANVLKTANFHTVAYGVLGFIDGVARKWFRAGMEYPLRDELPVILEVVFNGFVREEAHGRTFYVPPENRAHDEPPGTG